jgi:CHAD domain-containing protein
LSLFRGVVAEKDRRDIARRLKWIAKALAEAREWDVFQDGLLAPLQVELSDDPSLKGFADEVGKLRRSADRRASEILASARYTESVLRIGEWWDGGAWEKTATVVAAEPAIDFARDRIRKLHRRLRKLGDRIAELDDAKLHEVRIRAKRLRYAIGFFGGLFPTKAVRAHAEALAEIQDCLGALNDSVVVHQLLSQAGQQAKELDATVFARASGIIMGWNTARREEGLKRLPKSWRRYESLDPFWK